MVRMFVARSDMKDPGTFTVGAPIADQVVRN